jgi:hypothetical protein
MDGFSERSPYSSRSSPLPLWTLHSATCTSISRAGSRPSSHPSWLLLQRAQRPPWAFLNGQRSKDGAVGVGVVTAFFTALALLIAYGIVFLNATC